MISLETLHRIIDGRLKAWAAPVFRWATVTAVGPLAIAYPGQSPLPFAPAALCAPGVGQSVLTVAWLGQTVVLGALGGPVRPLPVELAGSVDLNTMTAGGTWTQSHNADAASGTNYPVAFAGLLEVETNGSNMVWQRYTPYKDGGAVRWWRNLYAGNWGAWRSDTDDTVYRRIRVKRSANLSSISANTWTRVDMDTTVASKGSGLTLSGGNVSIADTGWYEVNFGVSWDPVAAVPLRRVQLETGTTAGSNALMKIEQTTEDVWVGHGYWDGQLTAGTVIGISIYSASTNTFPLADFSYISVRRTD